MARIPAIASRPVAVTDTKNGKQFSLPVSSIYFEDGVLKAEGALYLANQKLFDDFLAYLVATRGVAPGAPPAVKPAMMLRAKRAGAMGNFIRVTFADVDSGANPKFNAEVAEADTYGALTPDTVQKTLGASAAGGTDPGLVFVPGAAPAANAVPRAGVYALALGGNPAATAVIPLAAGGGDAFTVQAAADGAEGERTQVEIKDVDIAHSTFTLVATWKKATAAKIAAADMAGEFSYEIDVTPPEGQASVGTPQAGVVTLAGGTQAAAARQAAAVAAG